MSPSIIILAIVITVILMGALFLVTHLITKKRREITKSMILERNPTVSKTAVIDESEEKKEKPKQEKKDTKTIAEKLKKAAKSGSIDGMPKKSIRYMLIQAGLETPVYRFWIYSILSAVLTFLACRFWIGTAPIVTILLTFVGFLGLPRFILAKKVHRRQSKFLSELPDCLDAMQRLLKSGMPISEAIAMSAREYTGPIGEEMSRVYEAQRVGDSLGQAVQKLAVRVPLPEVQMLATAIIIQSQTGSSLSEVLQNLSNVIRQRFRLKRKVEALSAEAKISAAIIGCLPLVVIGAMYLLNKDYISLLWTTGTGKMLSYGAIAWMGCGVLIMRQMINFKV
jgi:tight adherence protein B